MADNALLEQCRALGAQGLGFDAIWEGYLSRNPEVTGRMVRPAVGRCVLVPLVSGRILEFDETAKTWHLRGGFGMRNGAG
jgi:hypothetical protein